MKLDEESNIAWEDAPGQGDNPTDDDSTHTDMEPPRLQQRGTIHYSKPGRGKAKAGLLAALMNREEQRPDGAENPRVYYKVVDPDIHYHRALESYCISESALMDAKNNGVELILIGEKDDDETVLEFTLADYLHAENVPGHYLETERDPQKHLGRDDARAHWTNHRGKLFLPADAWERHVDNGGSA